VRERRGEHAADERRLARLAGVTTVLTLLAVTAGGLVRATGSGLGCPGWPRCYGRWIPPANHHAIIEMSHRYFVSASIVGAIVVCALAFWRHRHDRPVLAMGLAIVPLFFAQAALGAYVVNRGLKAWTVVAHLGLAMVVVSVLVVLVVRLRPAPPAGFGAVRVPAAAAAAGTFGLLLLGSYVTGRDAGLAFKDWPLMGGRAVPQGLDHVAPMLQFAHRVGALLVVGLIAWLLVRAKRADPVAYRLAHVAAGLLGVEIALGALNVFTRLHSAVVTAHLATSALIWTALVAVVALAWRAHPAPTPEPDDRTREPAPAPRVTARQRVAAFVALTKPRIIELLLVTTVPTMVVAKRGIPSGWLVLATVGGGALAAGGANAINMFVDRDIDRKMRRTQGRPLVTGAVAPAEALVFAVALEVAAAAELWVLVNPLSALLAVGATLFYVFVYTLWLKRSSSRNIVIGGAAGAVPVLVGWSAVTGTLGWPPVVLFALIFYWTPPHFWALAIRYRDDYAAADVPMLPVVTTLAVTARRIQLYTQLLWAVSLVFYEVAGMGDLYLAAAMILGGIFTWHAVQLRRDATTARAMRLFGWSISYISLLFGAMAADRLVHL
jgi:protoheme IX farnesyltransferase